MSSNNNINNNNTERYFVLLYKGQPMTCNTLKTDEGEIKTSLSTIPDNPIWKVNTETIARAAIVESPIWADSTYHRPFIPKQYREGPFEVALLSVTTELQQVPPAQEQAIEGKSF